jgi:hypothetical protein
MSTKVSDGYEAGSAAPARLRGEAPVPRWVHPYELMPGHPLPAATANR